MRRTSAVLVVLCVLFFSASCGRRGGVYETYVNEVDEIEEAEDIITPPEPEPKPIAEAGEETGEEPAHSPAYTPTLAWQFAYAQLLRDYKEYAAERSSSEPISRFILLDVDNNGIPELLILANHGIVSQVVAAYTFADNMATPVTARYELWFSLYSTPAGGQSGIIIDASDSGFSLFIHLSMQDNELVQKLSIMQDWTRLQSGYEGQGEFFLNGVATTEYEYNYLWYSVFGGSRSSRDGFTWHWPMEITASNINEIIYGWRHPPPPYYRQVTGEVTAIRGLLTPEGNIHPYVSWLELDITDENGTQTTLLATAETVVPFGGLAVGETITGFVLTRRPRLPGGQPMYIVSALITNVPEGLGIHVHYFEITYTTRINVHGNPWQGRMFLNEQIPNIGDYLLATDERSFLRTDETYFIDFRNPLNGREPAGFVILYELSDTSHAHTPIYKGFFINENFDTRSNEHYMTDFVMPKMHALTDFEILDLPVYLHQERFPLDVPPIIYHDGTTIMIPLAPLAEQLWWGMGFFVGYWGFHFGIFGGGSGETAAMQFERNYATGLGRMDSFGTPPILVDGIIYLPLFGFFVGVSVRQASDAFIYNGEIHIVNRGWSFLHSDQIWRRGFGVDEYNPISADVSGLPIYVDGRMIDAPPAFLSEDKLDIMLPLVPLAKELGFSTEIEPCGCVQITLQSHTVIVTAEHGCKAQYDNVHDNAIRWTPSPWRDGSSTAYTWVNGEVFLPFWGFFRGWMNVGGFVSYTRIELFATNAYSLHPAWW